jgi:ADP-heptose:LPS heptosyltransferase
MTVVRSDDLEVAEAVLTAHHGAPRDLASALTTLQLVALACPRLLGPSSAAACERVLRTRGLPAGVYDRAMWALAGVLYSRPDLVGDGTVSGLRALFAGPPQPASTNRLAADMLGYLPATPAAPRAVELLLRLLAEPDRPPALHEALLRALDDVAFWAIERLDLPALVSLAECEHLAGQRERLLHRAIERAISASPAEVTGPLFDRLTRLYSGSPSWKYCSYSILGRRDVPIEVRRRARAAAAGTFPLHEPVAGGLGRGRKRVLVAQNIKDRQGDEIIRTVPLLQSLLDSNPRLEVVLVTARQYLYAHPRITTVPIDDRAGFRSVLSERFDALVDFFEAHVPQVNYDLELEREIQAYRAAHAPFLFVSSLKGWNHFVYQRVDLESHPYAEALGLDRLRVENVYEPTFRLIAELGLPPRLGEEPPGAESVLAGLPCPEAEAAWRTLTEQNTERCPVALVCPFGGAEPLKGYVERKLDDLVERLRGLIHQGFYAVLLPSGTPWGSAAHARRVVDGLEAHERVRVTIAPDPADGSRHVRYESNGVRTVPYASYVMRLVTYWVRFADLVVTVEGWMVHAAYCLGKPYRVLMLPYSHPAEWHPYGRTRHQEVIQTGSPIARRPPPEPDGSPPLPEQPRKLVLLSALRGLGPAGEAGDARALPLLRLALQSEDRDVRLAAAESLGRFLEPGVEADLLALLDDPGHRVRSAAARALLERGAVSASHRDGARREHLLAHLLIGQEARDWIRVVRLGEGARRALRVAAQDDDPVVCREAAEVIRALDRRGARGTRVASLTARLRLSGLATRLFGRRADGA